MSDKTKVIYEYMDNVDGVDYNQGLRGLGELPRRIYYKSFREMSMDDKIDVVYDFLVAGKEISTIAIETGIYESDVESTLGYYSLREKLDIAKDRGACSKHDSGLRNVLRNFIDLIDDGYPSTLQYYLSCKYGIDVDNYRSYE